MLSDFTTKYSRELMLAENILQWKGDNHTFTAKVKQFDENALRTYTVLLAHLWLKDNSIPSHLVILTPEDMFRLLNGRLKSSACVTAELDTLLVDAFEIIVCTSACSGDELREICKSYLTDALRSENEDVISIYVDIASRIDQFMPAGVFNEIHKMIIGAVHGNWPSQKLFTKALLLIESSVRKQQNQIDGESLAGELLEFVWRNLCMCNAMKHQCKICYSIMSQLITIYLVECQKNSPFCGKFLNQELWSFIRSGIESTEVLRRKQSIYMLRNILDFTQRHESLQQQFKAKQINGEIVNDKWVNTWQHYFLVLENLLEIQSHLIISSLDQYLDAIVKQIPSYWYCVIFGLLLKHHNNNVIHYGVEFILRNGICFDTESNLTSTLYFALNNCYLYTEVKFSEENLANYLQLIDLNRSLEIINKNYWRPVPIWSIIKSVDMCLSTKKTNVAVHRLMTFLKNSLCIAKEMLHVGTFAVSILKSVGFEQFTLEQLLSLYDILPRVEIFDGITTSLDMQTFQTEFIQSNQIARTTKISYFQHAIPSVEDQLNFLDAFYEKNSSSIYEYPDYEFLLLNSMYAEKSLYSVLQVFKPRLYGLVRPNGIITVDSLLFAVSLLQFITSSYRSDDDNVCATYEMIKKVATNFNETIRNRNFGNKDATKEALILNRIVTINATLASCVEVYPNRMEVLAILCDAVLLEDYSLDLRRFDPDNKDDFKVVQSLYDWFLDESVDLKTPHRASIVYKILNEFPNVECEIWKAYKILLAGKSDVKCIFKLTQPLCASEIDDVLVDALIYGEELKGEESSSTYNQRVRLAAMRAIGKNKQTTQIKHLKGLLFVKNDEIYRARYFMNSYHHSMKLRITQALAFLFRLDPEWDERLLKPILIEANQTNVTHINEMILAEMIDPATIISIIEKIEGNKGLPSMFAALYYVCCKHFTNADFIKQTVDFLIKYIFTKQIVVRTAAQIILVKICEKFELIGEHKQIYESLKSTHTITMSKNVKWTYAYDYRFNYINCQHLLHSMYTMREIPRLTQMNSDEYYKHEIYDEDDNDLAILSNEYANQGDDQETREMEIGLSENGYELKASNSCTTGNVQKKVVPFRETVIDRQILSSLPDGFQLGNKTKGNSELIVLASLLSKIANLGGLSRSCEVFGAQAIALDSLKYLKYAEFTSLSMASEKWLKFIEVKSFNLLSYLLAMKSKGYCIVGAEQTASGEVLHKTRLPKKMILVLGHEKDGIPVNIINLLDMAIEIPQFGVVRSLNVHVTASIFMWEYCKQHFIENS